MLKTLFKSVFRLPRINKRQCSWCPSEPLDPCTQFTILHNGVRIATEELDSPLACVSLTVRVGPRYETAFTNGMTHFIEHMAFKGFRTMNKEKLENEMKLLGAKMTVHTTRELQVFSVILPSQHASVAVDKLYRIATELDLNEDEINMEKCNIELEMEDADNDPKQVVFDYLHATAFQGTPLGQRVIGTSDNLDKFDHSLIENFICEHYQPYRFALSTSGQVSHDSILQHAETRFGGIAPQPCCEPEPGPSRYTGSQVIFRDDSMPLCHAAIAFEAPGYKSNLYYTMLVLKCIVGSWDRSQGRGIEHGSQVARNVALHKLCERIESFYIAYRDIGLFGVYFVADKWNLEDIVLYVQDQWMQLCVMAQDTDVERGVNCLLMQLAYQYSSVVKSSHDIGRQMLHTCGRKSLMDLSAYIHAIKTHNVRAAADKVLYDRCPAVAVVGPTEAMPDYLRIRAGQWWLRL